MVCYQKCIISQGIGIVCLNMCFFIVFVAGFLTQGFEKIIILFDLGRELNLMQRHFVFTNRISFLRNVLF